MALPIIIGGNGTLFVGEDKVFRLELIDEAGLPVDMTPMTLVFDVRAKDNSPAPPIFSVTPTLTGVYNVVRATNTQRALAPLSSAQLNTIKAKTYRCSWKRLDAPETVLAWGDFAPEKATAP